MLRGGRKTASRKPCGGATAPAVGKDIAISLQSFPVSTWEGLARA